MGYGDARAKKSRVHTRITDSGSGREQQCRTITIWRTELLRVSALHYLARDRVSEGFQTVASAHVLCQPTSCRSKYFYSRCPQVPMYCAITALDGYPSHSDNIHYIRLATLIYALPPSTDNAITSILDTPYIRLLLPVDICLHLSRATRATRATSSAHL